MRPRRGRMISQATMLEELGASCVSYVSLSPEMWATAAAVGRARIGCHRRSLADFHGDPGKHLQADSIGAVGEVLLAKMIMESSGALRDAAKGFLRNMLKVGYQPGMADADLVFSRGRDHVSVDAKAQHFCFRNRYVCVTVRSFENITRPGTHYLMPLVQPLSRKAFIPALIPHEAVAEWRRMVLTRPHDPVFAIGVDDFLAEWAPGCRGTSSLGGYFEASDIQRVAASAAFQSGFRSMLDASGSGQEVGHYMEIIGRMAA